MHFSVIDVTVFYVLFYIKAVEGSIDNSVKPEVIQNDSHKKEVTFQWLH